MKRGAAFLALLALLAAGCDEDKKAQAVPAKPKGPPPGPTQRFESRPDLKPPIIKVVTPAKGTAPGYVFFAPKLAVKQAGPMIMDNKGEIVWFHPLKLTKGITDFRVQQLSRQAGAHMVARQAVERRCRRRLFRDLRRRRIARLPKCGRRTGYAGDVHEFLITKRNTALIPIYHRRRVDLTSLGGPKNGLIWDGIVQEIDIRTGRALFEWHSYPEISIEESYSKPPRKQLGTKPFPYDYFHLNSVNEDTDGNLLLSARNTHAVYKVNRRTGKVMWRLGGKQSDFTLGPGVRFAWQHDAQRQPDGTIYALRQRRRASRAQAQSRPRPGRGHANQEGEAGTELYASQEAALPVRGQRTVPFQRECLRRLGRLAVPVGVRPRAGASSSTSTSGMGRRPVRTPTPTAPTASPGRAVRPTSPRSRSSSGRL